MITNRDELITNIYNWLIRDQANDSFVNTDLVGTYIQMAESEMNRELKIQDLISSAPVIINASGNAYAVPDGYRGVVSFEYDDKPFDIEFFSTRRAMKDRYYGATGRPGAYTIIGNDIVFSNTPDGVHNMTMDYYKDIPALSETQTTNIILQKYPDAYLYGGIRQALLNLNIKDRLEPIATIYADAIRGIKEDDKTARLPSSGGRSRARTIIGG